MSRQTAVNLGMAWIWSRGPREVWFAKTALDPEIPCNTPIGQH